MHFETLYAVEFIKIWHKISKKKSQFGDFRRLHSYINNYREKHLS